MDESTPTCNKCIAALGIPQTRAARQAGWPMAVGSSSKNANAMLRQTRLADGRNLLGVFAVNVCGRQLRHGKPDPEIFRIAARELQMSPGCCLVAEDTPAGIQAARACGMVSRRESHACTMRQVCARLVPMRW